MLYKTNDLSLSLGTQGGKRKLIPKDCPLTSAPASSYIQSSPTCFCVCERHIHISKRKRLVLKKTLYYYEFHNIIYILYYEFHSSLSLLFFHPNSFLFLFFLLRPYFHNGQPSSLSDYQLKLCCSWRLYFLSSAPASREGMSYTSLL